MSLASVIPAELRDLKAWLVWRFVSIEGEDKPRKVPHYADGSRRRGKQGSAEDLAHLVDFDTAMSRAAKFDGVGLALRRDLGIVALDFDNCVFGGEVLPEVLEVVAGTYAEFSPSGNGVRALFRGELPDRKSTGDVDYGFEVFCDKGFVTVTGNLLDEAGPLQDLPASAVALFDRRFGQKERERRDAGPSDVAPMGLGLDELRRILDTLDPNMGRGDWVNLGMALHHETEGSDEGLNLWDEWSSTASNYKSRDDVEERWFSFGRPTGAPATMRRYAGLVPARVEDFESLPALPLPPPNFARDGKGRIEATLDNLGKALERPDLCGFDLRFDEFLTAEVAAPADRPGAYSPITDAWMVKMRRRLEVAGFKPVGKELMRDAVLDTAEERPVDSAIQWAESLRWDGVSRVDRFLADCFGAEDTAYATAVSRYIWTALAGRIMSPGCQADMVPILVGAQGARKSSALAAMVPPDHHRIMSFDQAEIERSRIMQGAIIVELAELQGLKTKAVEGIKAWITRRREEWVPKYKEKMVSAWRRCLFFGTTNDDDFLADPTGERRWLPIRVARAEVERIAAVRDQLWAEGLVLWTAEGVAWQDAERLARDEHAAFRMDDSWEDALERWATEAGLGGVSPADEGFTTHEALVEGLGFAVRSAKRLDENRCARALKLIGYDQVFRKRGGKTVRLWLKVTLDTLAKG